MIESSNSKKDRPADMSDGARDTDRTEGGDTAPVFEGYESVLKMGRRDAIKTLLGASTALWLGAAGCERKPMRQIVSRVSGPEFQQPDQTLEYASTWTEGTFPYGVLIKTVEGRPVKVEGNPDHPVNQGTSSAAMQAAILSLYDPDRLRNPRQGGKDVSWEEADRQIVEALGKAGRVALVTRSNLGAAEQSLVRLFLREVKGARHFVHESADDGPRRATWRDVFAAEGEPIPRLDRARVIVSFDADFLGQDGNVLQATRDFSERRHLDGSEGEHVDLPRFYAFESAMTVTSGNADHRIRLRPSVMAPLALALLAAVRGNGADLTRLSGELGIQESLVKGLLDDLENNRGNALVLAGGHLPRAAHAAVALLNSELDAYGNTLGWSSTTAGLTVSDPADLEQLLRDGVDVALFLDVNPGYDWPGGDFGALLSRVKLAVAHTSSADETAALCRLVLPSSHNFESWNDANPRTGLNSVCQPVIAPLFSTRQPAQSLLGWLEGLGRRIAELDGIEAWEDYLQRRWTEKGGPAKHAADGQEQAATGQAEAARTALAPPVLDGLPRAKQRGWERALGSGVSILTAEDPFPRFDAKAAELIAAKRPRGGDAELVILPHHAVHDGRHANNGWLQELPDPVTKMVWGNGVTLSPAEAEKLGVSEGDLVNLGVGNNRITLPAVVEPGTADGVAVVTLGHGREAGGEIAKLAGGGNAAVLVGADDPLAPRVSLRVALERAGGRGEVVRVQKEFSMHGRPIAIDGTAEEYRHDAAFVAHKRHLPEEAELYEPVDYSRGHKWVMSIDMNRCTGCSACVTACQAENNIPIVGREECEKGREMHWIRIDRYREGDSENPTVHNLPMLCQQCDHAPCESVCPVNATAHTPEGLNDMTYNRCVGTRYCANNCPYKVRRFNYFRYQERQLRDPVQELVFNPQVTVRSIGVMEKCTFCVQRINAAKFTASNAGTPFKPAAIVTACQQACPAGAISFGDANDGEAEVVANTKSPRAYKVLEELNVQPSISYLARVRNPQSDGESDDGDDGSHG